MHESETDMPDGVELRADVCHCTGGGRELSADLYLPAGAGEARPAVVYAHGGGWNKGTRAQFAPQAAEMARRGFVGLCVEYRFSDEAPYPAAVEDLKCAVRYLRAHADVLGVDPDRIAVAGGSAGGHLALLTAVTPELFKLEGQGGHGDYSSAVRAAVGFNPAVDLRERAEVGGVRAFMGGPPDEVGQELYAEASPICHVDAETPPVLLLHGTEDTVVPYEQAVAFCEAVEAAGGHAELFTAEGAGHGFFNKPPWYQPTLERMADFLQRVL